MTDKCLHDYTLHEFMAWLGYYGGIDEIIAKEEHRVCIKLIRMYLNMEESERDV